MDFSFNIESQAIFKNVFAFFGTLSSEGYVLRLDGKVFERTTTDPKLLVGQKFSETVYWQATEHTSETLEHAVAEAAGGNSQKVQLDFRVSADETINIELYLHKGNDERAIFFCAQEFTVREKEIEYYKERSERLLFAAENADIGLWFWDLQQDKIYSTPKCNELFEASPHGIITLQTFLNVIHPEDIERVRAALNESQLNGKDYNAEYRVIYSDGNINWIEARGRSYLDSEGNPRDMMGIVRRVTDRKLAGEELTKVYDREKKARNEAEDANRAKDFFLAVVSHELRSPLNAILGWAKILLSKKVDDDTRRNALETIEKSARAQAKLIDDLVDSSRVASGKLRLELRPVNLYEVIENVYLAQLPTAAARKIALTLTADKNHIKVFGDQVRLQQIFSNLISNALKFTSDNGTIEIIAATDEKTAKVVVRDNGKGIDEASLPTIFQQFQQGKNQTTRNVSGLGLGLSIVKILAEKHNGTVAAASAGIGRGATFTVTLPLESAAFNEVAVKNKPATTASKPLSNIKVLIVEDDTDSREVLHLFLEQSGAAVKSADSAQQAIILLHEAADDLPDVIVSDLAMPGEDGYSLINRIRHLPVEQGGKIPAMALSAFASVNDKQKAYDVGFQKYHTKPFEPDGIIEDIKGLLEQ